MAKFVEQHITAVGLVVIDLGIVDEQLPPIAATGGGQTQGVAPTTHLNFSVVIEVHIRLGGAAHLTEIQNDDAVETAHHGVEIVLIRR